MKNKDGEEEMKCHGLRDNKGCARQHTQEDLNKAREMIRKKGGVPTFNAFDTTDTFRHITTEFMKDGQAKAVVDTGAKKTVCGAEWLRLYEGNLAARNKTLPRDARQHVEKAKKTGDLRSFQFGGGAKTSKGRVRLPCVIRTNKTERNIRITTDVVPGWMPLLFSRDAQKYHKIFDHPLDDCLYSRELIDGKEVDMRVVNGGVDHDGIGIGVLDLLGTWAVALGVKDLGVDKARA